MIGQTKRQTDKERLQLYIYGRYVKKYYAICSTVQSDGRF